MGGCDSKQNVNEQGKDKPTGVLSSIRIGNCVLPNRMVLSAMTRNRCDFMTSVPNDLLCEYYTQRAKGCKMLLTECSAVSALGNCYTGNGAIYNDEQIAGWKKVTESVHKENAKIFLQIWHGGRTCHPACLPDPTLIPVGPSAIAVRGTTHTMTGPQDHIVPKELTEEEITCIVGEFKCAAENAMKAGFDGVQIHGANGYLVDEFLRDYTNTRTDKYGGCIENRMRFPLEVVDAVIGVYGAERVGIKISPLGRFNDMFDSDPKSNFTHFVKELAKRNLCFIECMGPDGQASGHEITPDQQMQIMDFHKEVKCHFKGIYIANSKFTFETGNQIIADGIADMVSYGTLFISNPDLCERFANGWPLASVDWPTVYMGGAKGFNDYPCYDPTEVKKVEETPNSDGEVKAKVEETDKVVETANVVETAKVEENFVEQPEAKIEAKVDVEE